MAISEIADQASGGHLSELLQTSQEKLDSGLAEDTRDAVLEMAKLVAYNGTQLRIVIELVAALVEKTDACAEIDRRWSAHTVDESERPELRDVVVGATSIAPAYASSTAPLRKLYVEVLRNGFPCVSEYTSDARAQCSPTSSLRPIIPPCASSYPP